MPQLKHPKTEDRFDAIIEGGEAVTPNDAVDLTRTATGLNVAVAGNVKITTLDNSEITLNLAAGVCHRVFAKRVWATGTTATGIVALW